MLWCCPIASVNKPQTSDPSVSDETLVAFCNLLDLALVLAELGTLPICRFTLKLSEPSHTEICETGLPLALIEELFDSQTIPSCERLFQYLESRIERITAGIEGGRGKGLILLRLCNELLRRLSKTEDTIFCGRILIFLSKSFPIGEKSGVNLRGDFNVQNVTVYDETPQQLIPTQEMEVDEKEEEKKEEVSAIIEGDAKSDDGAKGTKAVSFTAGQDPKNSPEVLDAATLYPIFWSLQGDFADPPRLFQPENFKRFKEGLAATMAKFQVADEEAFKSTGKVDGAANGLKRPDDKKPGAVTTGEKRKREESDEDESRGEGFNPKYLTSPELFELEVMRLALLDSMRS